MRLTGDSLEFHARLPACWKRISFAVRWQGRCIESS
ncbi:MAG: glycosyl hydrolase family 65 protein [Phycisphaerae bacterium]